MNKYGGIRNLLRDVDFKYIEDPTRIIWSKSVIQNVQKIVDFVATIPYNNFRYDGDIYFLIKKDIETKTETDIDIDTELNYETVGYTKINVQEEFQYIIDEYQEKVIGMTEKEIYELNRRVMNPEKIKERFKKNIMSYNFFGGITYELLNDRYKNVNLYNYVDPTSDIDVLLLMNDEFVNHFKNKIQQRNSNLIIDNTLVYKDEHGMLMMNDFPKSVANYIYNYLLDNLNTLNLHFENSVPFDDSEYYAINNLVRSDNLGFRSNEIGETNARLISYFDDDFLTFRIQLVLKMQIQEKEIVDHFFEFLINFDHTFSETAIGLQLMRIPIRDKMYQISSLSTLFYDNLNAYKKRESLIISNITEARHKGLNHVCRTIYLLDLIKNNIVAEQNAPINAEPNIYKDLAFNFKYVPPIKNKIFQNIQREYVKSYMLYVYIDGKIIYKKIPTKYIFKAFESTLSHMSSWRIKNTTIQMELNTIEEPDLTEEKMYDMLTRFFNMNSSPFRNFIMKSPQTIHFDLIRSDGTLDESRVEMYRERMMTLEKTRKNEPSVEVRGTIGKEMRNIEQEFIKSTPYVTIDENLKGGKQHRKTKRKRHTRKYKNRKMRIRKTKTQKTKRTRRYFK